MQTTIYLTKEDKYSDLEKILQKCCLASGAKFNLEKTEILPIGSRKHHQDVTQSQRLNPADAPWSEHINIAKDGSPIWILGAWIGNKIDHTASWETTIHKIEKSPYRWNTYHPTLEGKQLITQMIIGGIRDWEDHGWIDIANSNPLKATAYHLRKCAAQTMFRWVKGHGGNLGNEQADRLARQGADKATDDELNTNVPKDFNLQGIKLSAITQNLAYKGINQKTHLDYKRQTLALLDVTRFAIKTVTNTLETDQSIWQNCKNKDVSKKYKHLYTKPSTTCIK
ncbi:hypothetical protein BDR04DRAFT_1038898 [Suillus decipiens]|nr:hypothetical protein BDR04DRAFT_1038898 [Suillus decipiens]